MRWMSPFIAWLACGSGLGLCWPAAALAAPELRCQVSLNGSTHQHTFKPMRNPYEAGSVDLDDRFRFKAVVVGETQTVEHVHLYVYYLTRRQPMLLQHAKYVQPQAQPQPLPDALTGRVAVYSPVLGKELAYACALHEVLP